MAYACFILNSRWYYFNF